MRRSYKNYKKKIKDLKLRFITAGRSSARSQFLQWQGIGPARTGRIAPPLPCLRNRPRSGWPLSNFVMNRIFLKTRMFRLSDGEEIMTLAFFVLIQYRSVTDRQTDIPPLAIPAVCIARYANALVLKTATRASMHLCTFTVPSNDDIIFVNV